MNDETSCLRGMIYDEKRYIDHSNKIEDCSYLFCYMKGPHRRDYFHINIPERRRKINEYNFGLKNCNILSSGITNLQEFYWK